MVMLIFALVVRNYDFAYETVRGGTHVYAYKPWVSVGLLFGGIAFSIWLYRSPEPPVWAGSKYDVGPCGALVITILTVLATFALTTQVVEVNENGFVAKGRIWGGVWDGREQNVQFADVERIRMVWEERHETGAKTGHGMRTFYNLLFERTTGASIEMSVNNDVSRLAAAHILEIAADRSIPISKPYSANADKWYTAY